MTKHYCVRCGRGLTPQDPWGILTLHHLFTRDADGNVMGTEPCITGDLCPTCSAWFQANWPFRVGPVPIPIGTLTVNVEAVTDAFRAALARVEPALLRFSAAVKALSETPIEIMVGKADSRQSPETRA